MKVSFTVSLFFVALALYGQRTSSEVIDKSATVASVATLNDSFNGSFAPNRDNYLSFGFDFKLWHKDLFNLHISDIGYTNRSRADTSMAGRMDEIRLLAQFKVFEYKGINVYPTAGLVLSGNLGGRYIQNSMHENVGEPIVTVEYDYEDTRANTLVGLYLNNRLNLIESGINVHLKSELWYYEVINYSNHLHIGSNLVIGQELQDNFQFGISYERNNAWASNTMCESMSTLSGLKLGFSQDISFLTLGYDFYPSNGFGFGRFGVNVFKRGSYKEYETADAVVEFKALFNDGGFLSNYKWGLAEISGHHVYASIGHNYRMFRSGVIEAHPDVMGQHLQITAGAETYLFGIKPKFQIDPYVGLGLGYMLVSTFSGADPTYISQFSGSPMAYADVGVRFGGPIPFISKNALLGLTFGNYTSLPFNEETQVISGNNTEFLTITNHLYLGLNFVIDM